MALTQEHRVVRSQVEPRIVERRQRVAAAERRNHRRRIVIAIGIAAFLAALVGVAVSPLLAVGTIEVSGTDRIGTDDVLRAAGIRKGDRMVDLDAAAARQAAMKEPMIASAVVTRSWPSTVRIEVTEEQPMVRIHDGDQLVAVVTRTGMVLDASSFDGEILPSVELAGASKLELGRDLPDRLLPTVAVVENLPTTIAGRLERAVVDGDGSITFDLGDGVEAQLGGLEDMPAKILSLRTVIEQVAPECMDVVDVTEPSRPTVTRRSGCTPAEPTTKGSTSQPAADSAAPGTTSDDEE